ncbi:hypothetical protein, partial [Xenorhabdus cabanillasii]|uniref:hypothetical protein n=1 Tax=Xenorhabdus cabanillasii TaxID=351673 RepID=UPI001C3F41D6
FLMELEIQKILGFQHALFFQNLFVTFLAGITQNARQSIDIGQLNSQRKADLPTLQCAKAISSQ